MAEPRPEAVPQRAVLADAMEHANLPSLVAVLYQLTGDRRYLADPYRPTRSRGMEDNDPGGFGPEVQAEIRAAAVDAVLAWAGGRPPAVPAPTGDALLELIELAVGEPVPPEYEAMAAEDMGFTVPKAPVAPPSDFRVVVIGAGVSGMLAAIRLAEAGIDHVVLEKNADVGGTWLENAYPGAGVDTPSHLYSYSFAPRRWSTHFGKRDEVLTYLRDVADAHDLREVIRFGTEVASAVYRDQRWIVTTAAGETLTADAVITAVGQLNRPKIPPLPGLDAFRGPLFHSARWPADLDVTGKRVVVVGTGASAMQIVPAIAERAGHVTVFQRSPQWAAPNDVYFSPIDDAASLLMEHVPFYRRWYRTRLSWNTGDRVHASLQKDPAWEHGDRSVNAVNDGHRRVFTRYVESELAGRADLVAKALPDYPPFGKRMLLDNGWYAALRRDDVDLVTAPVAAVTPTGVRAQDGTETAADVVVLCTGFEAQKPLWPLSITRPGRADDRRRLGARRRRRAPGHHGERLPQPVPDLRPGHRARPRRQLHHDRRVPGALHRGGARRDGREPARGGGGAARGARRLRRPARRRARGDDLDPPRHAQLVPQPRGPGGVRAALADRRLLDDDAARRLERVRRGVPVSPRSPAPS